MSAPAAYERRWSADGIDWKKAGKVGKLKAVTKTKLLSDDVPLYYASWRPIATAPADGQTPILLWFLGASHPVFGVAVEIGGRVEGRSAEARGVDFTYWMPSPEGPR